MVTLEDTLKLAAVLILSAVFLRRRYGPVWPRIRQRLGPRWTVFVKIASVATLALWILLWVLASPEQRAKPIQFFEENPPWISR